MNEPDWKQSDKNMILCLLKSTRGRDDEWSAANWALWQIEKYQDRISDLGAYADELESKVDNART